ncbi:serine/threonine-protein kinase ssp1-like [Rhododendron vialii]|uniref:serine/threonine-protein kinase ssp1-like n=1 Tax=Rhododendron vialii TaxID=182163 RepID=UPI00265EE25F|nr:serine/threonine-protein kinase ssp1-like [Rhododendron vialii]
MEKNPFVQAGALSTDLGEIPHASPFPTPFDQAGAIDGGVDQLKDSCRFIPLCQILKATNDFDDALVIGTGGFGKVYKANIDDGATTTIVAIKRLSAVSNQGAEEFWTELKLLSKFRHANLLSLIGYCNENQEMIIVYEYMAGGTLANYLYKTSTREESGGSRSHLTWEQRLNICLDVARGLDYLHNSTLPGIIHRDVKCTNILLDEYMVAKVSDLGISKSMATYLTTHVSTNVKGTFGYLDPDYFLTCRLTKKSDVYAFGVVLLEVLCGRLAIDTRLDDKQINLVNWAKMIIKKGKLDRIIDPFLNGDISPHSLEYFAELANKCLHNQSKKRPTIAEVVESLEIALVSHKRKGRSQGTIAKAWTLQQGGGEIVGPIALSSSEFASANNKAQRVGRDKSGSVVSDSKKKRTGEQEDCEEINTSVTLDDLRQHYGRKRGDVAESLGVSVSTLKRICRRFGIQRWPNNIRRKKAGRPPDQHGEKNPSPTCKTLLSNGQTEMENEFVGHLEETNEFLPDFVEGPNEAGVSSECEFQLKNQWSRFSAYPNSDGPVVPHPHMASTQILGENMESLGDLRNLFASLEESLLQGHVSGSMWTVPPCLGQAPSQLMPTIAHTMGSSDDLRNLLPLVGEHVSGSINWTVHPCSVPALSQPMPTIAHTMGNSDDLRNLLALVEEPFPARQAFGSVSWTGPSCSDPTLSPLMPTIPHTMPTIPRMMPLLTERQGMRSVKLKATYGDTTIKFNLPLTSGISELNKEVLKRLEFEPGRFRVEYEDEDEDGVLILIACDEDARDYLQFLTSSGNQVMKPLVLKKVPNTTNVGKNH